MPEQNHVQMRGGRAAFIGRRARMQLPRGSLILHASLPPNPPRFSRSYPFLTQFLREILEVFWCPKWVIQNIIGKLSMSSFQRYKFCVNWSFDERVMAPGSRGAGTVFVCFSGEDSGQTRDATGEPRVARCSRSCHLSNAPRLVGQLSASRKDSAREGGCPGEKRAKSSAHFSLLFVCVHAHI